MPWWEIALIVVAAFVGAFLLWSLAAARRRVAQDTSFAADLATVNQALAAAHAQDKGWDPAVLEAAAREAFGSRMPGVELATLELVQVVDRPGTDEDQAVFRAGARDGTTTEITMGRRQGAWTPIGDS